MTVTPSTSDVADKAVSTDDGGSGMEVARLEAVLAALVETKVEAIKASSGLNKRSGSAPASPRRLRLTSTSTASSSLNHQHRRKSHHHHGHHHHHHHHHHRRRHDSTPCDEFIGDPTEHHQHNVHNGKARRRASESPRRPRKKRKHSKSPNILHGIVQDVQTGLDSRLELFGMDGDQDLALINFERTRDTLSDSCEYPQLHRSASYFPQSAAQLQIHYDDDDYVALKADELEEEEILSCTPKIEAPREKYHRPRRKRKRKRKANNAGPQEELVDPEELPPRARWTIVATACLLLTMSLLLVGVTLRMAPIIDDMGNGRRGSTSRRTKPRNAGSTRRKDSARPSKVETKEAQKIVENVANLEQARRHRRIAMIVLGTFLFLLAASVLVVVVTLTHSTFLSPPTGSRELAEHRARMRRENEELLNSLNRVFVTENLTIPP
ncbi:uncharacterized protein LOC143428015 [Xylocopa sonorina]|uniref:uncharacterized protein LOC143428015 n=1 Tax=Xylocopa sonorina TaxID=1818115 RepID=UPI00403B0B00